MINTYSISAFTVIVFMLFMYAAAQIKKDNSIVDIGWGMGFILITLSLILSSGNAAIDAYYFSSMIFIWGIRLTLHIYSRAKGRGEDFRYAEWRKNWGRKAAWIAFYKVFMLQGLLMLFIALPVLVYFDKRGDENIILKISGAVIFIIGFLFEAVGDMQLSNFKKNPSNKGRIITSGLWRITRHPNYFGEAVLWWGIALYSYACTKSVVVFLGPLLLNFLLLKVSGIPLLEKKYEGRSDWERYKLITPTFTPWIGKKG